MTLRDKIQIWVQKSMKWKSNGYPNLHLEEIAGREAFLRAVEPTFHPFPHDPSKALATLDTLDNIEQ